MSPRLGSPSLAKERPLMENVAGHAYSPLMLYPFATAAAVEVDLERRSRRVLALDAQFMTGSPDPVPNR